MKVIHFITAIDRSLGGVSVYIQLLAKELGKRVKLTLITQEGTDPLPIENAHVISLPLLVKDKDLFLFPWKKKIFIKQWNKILDVEQPDIVHINGIWMMKTWLVERESLKRGIKTYITPHGMLEPWIMNRHPWKKRLALLLFQKKALQKVNTLIATATSEKKNLLKLKYNDNIEVIPNGVDIGSIKLKVDWIRKKKILFLSRVHPKKGIELLLDAIYSLKHLLEGYEIIIAGEGEPYYIEDLKLKTKKKGCEHLINFIGGIYNLEKWNILKLADFLVLPTYSENFGYVIAESLASGTPVITTQGTPWEDINIFHCGYWINRDLDSLKESIVLMLGKSDNELKSMGLNGRRLIKEKFSVESMAQRMLEIYTKVL